MKKLFVFIIAIISICSCGVYNKLNVSQVCYQSIRPERKDLKKKIPEDAKIAIIASISANGGINVSVKNLTSSVMTIDRQKSFVVSNGVSMVFYNPNISVNAKTTTHTSGSNVAFNMGAAAAALGIGGAAGMLLGGLSVGGSGSNSTSVTSSTYNIDQQVISLAPNSLVRVGGPFYLHGVGCSFLEDLADFYEKKEVVFLANGDSKEKMFPFSITISYQIEDENIQVLTSSYYVSDIIIEPIVNSGKVNDALRAVIKKKPNACSEMWFLFHLSIDDTLREGPLDTEDTYSDGYLYDYK